MDLKKKDELMN